MIRRILIGSSIGLSTLALFVSCASKKPVANKSSVPVGDTAADTNISSQDMTFSPSGSDSGKILGLYTVHFAFNRTLLNNTARSLLAKNAKWINAHPGVTVQIEGHCDARGSTEYNLALGERRARAVKAYLVSIGVDASRMTVISYGKEKPIVPGNSAEAYAQNRRANFVPLGK